MGENFSATYKQSIETPEAFWRTAAEQISWVKAPQTVLDNSNAPFVRWFPDGELNVCYNAVDVHVEQGRGEPVSYTHLTLPTILLV